MAKFVRSQSFLPDDFQYEITTLGMKMRKKKKKLPGPDNIAS